MTSKNIIYKTIQDKIINQISTILNIKTKGGYLDIHELENDTLKISTILRMLPDIKRYFSVSNISLLKSENAKSIDICVSIIKNILKYNYEIVIASYKIKDLNIKTKRFYFHDIRN